MTLCLSLRTPSFTALLGCTLALSGCIDPKSLGNETDDESSSATEGDAGSATDDGPATATATATATDDGPATATDTATDDGPATATATGGNGCSPIDIAECVECECIGGEWSCDSSACVYDCAGVACGDACMMCPEDDPECTTLGSEGQCTAEGECVGTPPPLLGFCEGALQPGFEGELSEASGCSDMTVYAHDAADERAVVLSIDQGLVADAVASGMPLHAELPVTDPSVTLEARAGIMVTTNECNDVILPDEQIDETWVPSAGMVIVDIVPDAMDTGTATVELVDVVLHRTQPGPASITIDLTMADVYVGWLPG